MNKETEIELFMQMCIARLKWEVCALDRPYYYSVSHFKYTNSIGEVIEFQEIPNEKSRFIIGNNSYRINSTGPSAKEMKNIINQFLARPKPKEAEYTFDKNFVSKNPKVNVYNSLIDRLLLQTENLNKNLSDTERKEIQSDIEITKVKINELKAKL